MKRSTAIINSMMALSIITGCNNTPGQPDDVIYSSDIFTVYTDRVTQGPHTARAISPVEIESNYTSPEESGISQL
ncbi:hypothetical protein, partial [uncultured Muribaculum sp.]